MSKSKFCGAGQRERSAASAGGCQAAFEGRPGAASSCRWKASSRDPCYRPLQRCRQHLAERSHSEAQVLLDCLGGQSLWGGALLGCRGSQRLVHVLSNAHLHSLDRGGGCRGRQSGRRGGKQAAAAGCMQLVRQCRVMQRLALR